MIFSVLPCSVVYSSLQTEAEKEDLILLVNLISLIFFLNYIEIKFPLYYIKTFYIMFRRNTEEGKQWKSFVESVRSKLTVKQVVDGVRNGGQMSFDYLLLIVTAE